MASSIANKDCPHQSLFRNTNSPRQLLDIPISSHHAWSQFKSKHLMDSVDDSPGIFAISLNQTAEALFNSVGSDLGIAIEAVPDDWEESILDC